ncbi:hypothetical protein [Cellulomonas xiejunii]|uniref:Uncharacterized protein n=1 Tax=Cellulomonas xiejunii TaxID=2968083 RepID=A0ABY5KTF3_9CELL|nr:hypothetical protein [Cellulomonas xiejunii]MCC2322423.1 hypothetical protein [Cellulomonas xiejunii]UUI72471.1 hypothetical protein NP048_03105 [Cellulomonas xiejunii]
MPYTAGKPPLPETPDQLRARIPGWGADLDPADRPSVPRERSDLDSGAHWDFPDRQPETYPRERSIEHEMLPPVFGTAQPLHGLSGKIRRYSYERFSEGRAAHWLLLIAADRVDAGGAHLRSLLTLRPDNPITETGILAEPRRHPIASRRGRVDVRHQVLDPLIVGGPWIVGAAAAFALLRALRRR